MKRTDLIALAEKLHQVSTEENMSFDELDDIKQAADFLRQIAQAQPVAWLREQRDEYEGRATLAPLMILGGSDVRPSSPQDGATYQPLYTLPLED